MREFSIGDRIRVDIPDTTDPEHQQYHGKHGHIVDVIEDAAGEVTQNDHDSFIYRIEFENGDCVDFRRGDLRPPIS